VSCVYLTAAFLFRDLLCSGGELLYQQLGANPALAQLHGEGIRGQLRRSTRNHPMQSVLERDRRLWMRVRPSCCFFQPKNRSYIWHKRMCPEGRSIRQLHRRREIPMRRTVFGRLPCPPSIPSTRRHPHSGTNTRTRPVGPRTVHSQPLHRIKPYELSSKSRMHLYHGSFFIYSIYSLGILTSAVCWSSASPAKDQRHSGRCQKRGLRHGIQKASRNRLQRSNVRSLLQSRPLLCNGRRGASHAIRKLPS
jgi:hypothetical protein